MYVHKLYQTMSGYGDDIALIRLSRPAIVNNAVGIVCLPKQDNRVSIGKMCHLTGRYLGYLIDYLVLLSTIRYLNASNPNAKLKLSQIEPPTVLLIECYIINDVVKLSHSLKGSLLA